MHEQTPQLNEQLSAVMDGEASELELRRFLQRLDELDDAERDALYQQWERYQRASAGLAGESLSAVADTSFVSSIASQLDEIDIESVHHGELPQNGAESMQSGAAAAVVNEGGSSFWSKMAVAASFALAVTVGVQQLYINNQSEQLRLIVSAQQPVPSDPATLPSNGVEQQGVQVASASATDSPIDEQERQRRLQDYLQQHANQAAEENGQDVAPFARTAGFEDE